MMMMMMIFKLIILIYGEKNLKEKKNLWKKVYGKKHKSRFPLYIFSYSIQNSVCTNLRP